MGKTGWRADTRHRPSPDTRDTRQTSRTTIANLTGCLPVAHTTPMKRTYMPAVFPFSKVSAPARMIVCCRRHQVLQDGGEAAELDEVEFGELRNAVLAQVGEL